jgi:protein-tyrosine phosphatase
MNEPETLDTPAGTLTIAPATHADADVVIDVLDEAARWLTDRGIDQWTPGMFNKLLLLGAIDDGEVYVVRRDGATVATISLGWDDTLTWGPMPDDAGYVHGLAVRRAYGGQGVGLALLAWAERSAAAAGKVYLRLDCMARNPALRAYYERAGFAERRDIQHDEWSALYEQRVSQP